MTKQNLKTVIYACIGMFTFIAVAACTIVSTAENGAPTQEMAAATNSDLKEIGAGHAIYMRHCSQCHEAKLPASISSDAWHVIVPGMAWNAGLSKSEEAKVHKYIVAASKYNRQQR